MRVLWLPLAQVRATLHCLLAHGAGRVDLDDGAKTVAVRCPVCARTFWRRNPRYQSALSEAFLKPGTQGTTLTVAVLLLVVVAGWLSATRAAAPAGKSRATPVTRRDAPGAPALATTGDLGVPRGLQVPGADSVQDLTPLWYPAEPGDTWVYQRERRDGGIAHSDVARWRTEETIVSKATIPEGVLVFGRVRALDPIPASVVKATPAQMKKELEDSHALIRQGCVYVC